MGTGRTVYQDSPSFDVRQPSPAVRRSSCWQTILPGPTSNMVDSAETMSTKLFPAVILAVALGHVACSEDINPAVPSQPNNPVTETFTGTLTLNGGITHPFSVTSSGAIRASIASLAPDSTVTIGLSLGTWNGTAETCATVIANDYATVGTAIVGAADREGRLCVRVYDAAGTLPQPTDYELTVIRP